MSDQAPSSSTNHRFLHSKIRIKSNVSDLPNLTGTITEVKRGGGWFLTDNPEIVRPIRAREFDVLDEDEASHVGDGDEKEEDAVKDTKESQKDEEEDEQDDEEEESSSDNEEEDSNNYDKDQFLKIGTTIKITSGEHSGRICTISERRVGIFLKISVDGDIRLKQPDEIEVIEFKDPASDDDEEEEKSETTTKKGKKEKDFGHKKYIGASWYTNFIGMDGVGRLCS